MSENSQGALDICYIPLLTWVHRKIANNSMADDVRKTLILAHILICLVYKGKEIFESPIF